MLQLFDRQNSLLLFALFTYSAIEKVYLCDTKMSLKWFGLSLIFADLMHQIQCLLSSKKCITSYTFGKQKQLALRGLEAARECPFVAMIR